MGLKDDVTHAGGHLKDAAKHVTDAGKKIVKKAEDEANEASHRAAAEEEHRKRELLGDRLTVGEKAKSVAEETKQHVQAGVAGVKKKIDGA
jgi:vacuolar-type H+-ATPase subunit H